MIVSHLRAIANNFHSACNYYSIKYITSYLLGTFCFIIVPLAPQNLSVSIPGVAFNSTTLLVNWKRPLCDRGVLLGYELCYVESSVRDCDSSGVTVNITNPDQLSYIINDLYINIDYVVVVRARTKVGLGDPVIANGTTDEDSELTRK